MEPVAFLAVITWVLLPLVLIYVAAFVQRRRVALYHADACVYCAYEEVGRQERCTECGEPTRHLCHRCRHIVDARPGEPCPHCKKATIAAQCWRCGYDWRGLDSPRCPECGVWKPTLIA